MACVSIALDDGYVDHLAVAKTLYRRDLTATFFIITGVKESYGRRLLATRPDLIRRIYDMGHEVASHTVTHRNLTRLSSEALEKECVDSKVALEEVVEDEVMGLAYPYGAFDERVVEVVRRYYAYSRTVGDTNRWNEILDPYAIGSMGIKRFTMLPLKSLTADVKLAVLTLHYRNLRVVGILAEALQSTGLKVMTVGKALRRIGGISTTQCIRGSSLPNRHT